MSKDYRFKNHSASNSTLPSGQTKKKNGSGAFLKAIAVVLGLVLGVSLLAKLPANKEETASYWTKENLKFSVTGFEYREDAEDPCVLKEGNNAIVSNRVPFQAYDVILDESDSAVYVLVYDAEGNFITEFDGFFDKNAYENFLPSTYELGSDLYARVVIVPRYDSDISSLEIFKYDDACILYTADQPMKDYHTPYVPETLPAGEN